MNGMMKELLNYHLDTYEIRKILSFFTNVQIYQMIKGSNFDAREAFDAVFCLSEDFLDEYHIESFSDMIDLSK